MFRDSILDSTDSISETVVPDISGIPGSLQLSPTTQSRCVC